MIVNIESFIDEDTYCCGEPTEVRIADDAETERQSIIFSCSSCMKATKINIKPKL
jgi:hypothetical protein